MATTTINLNNIRQVTYNGVSVYDFLINGQSVWKGLPAVYPYSQQGSDFVVAEDAPTNFNGSYSHNLYISSDGSTLVYASPKQDHNGELRNGLVRVYKTSDAGVTWFQHGPDLIGELEADHLGSHVDMSYDGSVLVVGAWLDGPGDNGAIYTYSHTSTGYSLVSKTIGPARIPDNGQYVQYSGDTVPEFGDRFSVSDNGLVMLATSRSESTLIPTDGGNAPANTGGVRIYTRSSKSDTWGERAFFRNTDGTRYAGEVYVLSGDGNVWGWAGEDNNLRLYTTKNGSLSHGNAHEMHSLAGIYSNPVLSYDGTRLLYGTKVYELPINSSYTFTPPDVIQTLSNSGDDERFMNGNNTIFMNNGGVRRYDLLDGEYIDRGIIAPVKMIGVGPEGEESDAAIYAEGPKTETVIYKLYTNN